MDSRERESETEYDDRQVEISDLDASEFPLSPLSEKLNRWLRAVGRKARSRAGFALLCALAGLLLCFLVAQILQPWNALQHQPGGTVSGAGASASVPSLSLISSGQTAYLETSDHMITAYRADDGHVLWRQNLGGDTSISAVKQVLYCLVTLNAGALLEALNGQNGHVIWAQRLTAAGVSSALLVENGQIYVSLRTGWLETFRASDGRKLWSYRDARAATQPLANFLTVEQDTAIVETPDGISHLLRASNGTEIMSYIGDGSLPVIGNGMIYLFLGFNSIDETDGTIQALRATDGALLWRVTLRTNQSWTPTEFEGTVYADSPDGSILALRGTDGKLLWSYKAQSPVVGTPAGQNGRLYALLQDGSVVALRADSGALLWRTRITAFIHLAGYTPLPEGSRLFLSALEPWGSAVYALRTGDGGILWSHDMGSDNPLHTPVFFAGIFYLSQNDGSLDAWRASDGVHLWHYAPPSSIDWILPAQTGGILYIKAFDDSLVALQSGSGKILWSYRPPGLANGDLPVTERRV